MFQDGTLTQVHLFLQVQNYVSRHDARSSMKRNTYGFVSVSGHVLKLGGNKDDPLNLNKGSWNKRFLVLQDDLVSLVSC